MREHIKIKIRSVNDWENILCTAFVLIYFIWLQLLIRSFSTVSLILFLISFIAVIAFSAIYYKRPTVVNADTEKLRYRHIFGEHTIPYSDIKKIVCEPYTVRERYTSTQRIKLVITLNNDDEYELNDCVNTEDMISDRLKNRETDIPLMRLYEFILQHTEVSSNE